MSEAHDVDWAVIGPKVPPSLKVLIDNSVLRHGSNSGHNFRDTARPPTRPRRSDWLQQEIDVLPEIAQMIRAGSIQAYSSFELHAEAVPVLRTSLLSVQDEVFDRCEFQKVLPPLDRSKWGLSLSQLLDDKDVINYCKCFFLTPSPERTERFIEGMRNNPCFKLTSFEEGCLRRSHIFKQICYGIAERHYPDALHLWTAEENGLDVFLVHDRKFKNVIERQRVKLHCRVMFPTELLAEMQAQNESWDDAQIA